jgi:hypothetical protein
VVAGGSRPLRQSRQLHTLLGAAGVASAALSALKGLLDQVPDVIRSWRRVVDEARRAGADGRPPHPDDGGEGGR